MIMIMIIIYNPCIYCHYFVLIIEFRLKLVLKSKLNGRFLRKIGEGVDKRETWRGLRKADLKVETEAVICAA